MTSPPLAAFVVHSLDVPEEEGVYPAPFDGEKLSFWRNLGKAAGSERLGLRQERLPPGRRTSFTHAHSHEEELIYVLKGECHVRLLEPGAVEARELPLRVGHTISFPSGTGIAHCFVNHSARECLLLCVGERRRNVDRVLYPEDSEYDEYLHRNDPGRHWTH
ncbi:cupin domain-containing protein [Hyalangium sp.]|uniref:cupin domain-containing protein n=1 Tax=Hyalangium sp. TaxID=2028555 RepID=UPI002D6D492B|nr:cupin domain-containing protein [Hyalangium sp.]HYH96572.1 cupin domain-containing protein [Hyalangium sp.]